MGQVTDRRWKRGPDGTRIRTNYTGSSPWQVRWRDPSNRQKSKVFKRKTDADKYLIQVEHTMLNDSYIDPTSGLATVREYGEGWRSRQIHEPGTQVSVEHRLRNHVYPYFGNRPMKSVLPSEVQAWVAELSTTLAPRTVRNIYRHMASMYREAVADRMINRSPCDGTKLPKIPRSKVEPPSTAQVEAAADAISERYRVAVVLAAGTGLRRGEILGLQVDHIDFVNRTLRVEQQLLTEKGGVRIAPPKTDTSERTVSVADVVLAEVSEHLRRFPPVEGRVLSNAMDNPVRSNTFETHWSRARSLAGCPEVNFHDLRHFYASALIAKGCSVVAVQVAMGHAKASETLNTYSHLWPSDEDQTREAIQSVLAPRSCATNVQRQENGRSEYPNTLGISAA